MMPGLLSPTSDLSPLILRRRPARRIARSLLVNPLYEVLLQRAGLHHATDFLALPQTIVSGHPDRQVSRVMVGNVAAFLKVEHRVAWKDRLLNAWAGFGFSSKAWREARMLGVVARTCPCAPEWMAAGETSDGRAFLLVRDLVGFVSLREWLHHGVGARRRQPRNLGQQLAQLHAAGIAHVDLYANHVLVDPRTERMIFVDWQRAIRRRTVGLAARWRDLAALAATLPDDLASPRDQAICLWAYVREMIAEPALRKTMHACAAVAIASLVKRLQRRRHIRAKREPVRTISEQQLICLDGDALCVTPALRAIFPADLPIWLLEFTGAMPTALRGHGGISTHATEPSSLHMPTRSRGHGTHVLPDGDVTRLTIGCHSPPSLAWFQPTWISPQRRQMSLLFRLQRHGVTVPQVLAVGDRPMTNGQVSSFLFVRLQRSTPLFDWLQAGHTLPLRRRLLHNLGEMLARVHRAGCVFNGNVDEIAVSSALQPMLSGVTHLVIRRRFRARAQQCDLKALELQLRAAGCTRTDWRRVCRGYETVTL